MNVRRALLKGLVIPAMPLALNARWKLDERRQRALIRYYAAAGAGGLAAAVHTTQFQIRDPKFALFNPVTQLAAEEMRRAGETFVRIGGICGKTKQASEEADWLSSQEYHAGLLSLGAMQDASERELIEHAKTIAGIIPLVGFYLQPAVGGRILSYKFWRRFAEIENVVAIKIAPFNRYQTVDVVRAVLESGREDIALYTGNDDSIVCDLVTPFGDRRIVGGLLGQWAVWTKRAVELLEECHRARKTMPAALLRKGAALTDANAAIFDAANHFAGCIPGIHEILRRQGLLEGTWCLDPKERLSPGQSREIDRVCEAYPELMDDQFVAENLANWLNG